MKIRRIALRGLVVAPIVAASGAAAYVALTSAARERIVSSARARLALPVDVGSVSLGFGSVTLDRISVGGEDDPRMQLLATDVRVEASPLALAWGGLSAIDRVVIGSVSARVRATEDLHAVWKRRGDGGPGDRQREHTPRVLPELAVERLDAVLSDDVGELVSVKDLAVELGAEKGMLRVDELRFGDDVTGKLSLAKLSLSLDTKSARPRVRAGSLSRLELDLPAPPPTDTEDVPETSGGEGDAVAAPEKAATGLLPRLFAALERLAKTGVKTGGSAPPSASAGEPPSPLVSALSKGARVSLGDGLIRSSEGHRLVHGLRGSLERVSDDALQLSGAGKGAGGGSLAWDMRVKPSHLRADGRVELRSLSLGLIAPLLPEVPWHAPEDSRIDAELVVASESVDRISLEGRAELRDAAIHAARIAPEPVRDIHVAISGTGHFLPLARRLEITQGTLALSGVAADLSGAVEWTPDHYLFDIDARLPATACNDAVHAIGDDLLGDLSLAEWRGRIGGRVRAQVDSRDLDSGVLELEVDDRCEFTTVPAMADLRRFRMPFTHTVLEPDGSSFEMETGPGTPDWTYLEDISPFFVHAVLAHEDAQFFSHRGFSPPHIRNALIRNLKEGRYVVGASTISMQLVKNIFLRREKTLARKIQEVLLTWWTERVLEKRDILELYLNVIEYGPAVYGIRRAARHYFNRLPSQLSPAEAVYLSTILPNPKRYHVHFERGSLSPTWKDRMRKIFARMGARGWYSPEAIEYGLSELDTFRFVPEGTITEPREVPGSTAPLPYMVGFHGQWDTGPEPVDSPTGDVGGTEALAP